MEIEFNKVENSAMHLVHPRKPDEQMCIFYKTETCNPKKTQFKMCLKCHRCGSLTIERAIPYMFSRIVRLAISLMGNMGISMGSTGGTGSGGASGGAGGGGK
jgi:hypothetical protein